ncbi:MAG: Flp/Fap pilin component [Chloroflexota bacterium]|nr:Flp/Fap pilin component [Chloroflexota bacterium]
MPLVTGLQQLEIGRTRNGAASVLINRATMKLPNLFQRILDLLARDEGQGMVEYALILVLIAVVVIVVLIILGNQVQNVFCNISGGLGQ